MKTTYHPNTTSTAALRKIATKYRTPESIEEGLLLFGAEAELQRRQDEMPAPHYKDCHKATAAEMHP